MFDNGQTEKYGEIRFSSRMIYGGFSYNQRTARPAVRVPRRIRTYLHVHTNVFPLKPERYGDTAENRSPGIASVFLLNKAFTRDMIKIPF